MDYKPNKLKQYIEKSRHIVINHRLHIRLSEELFKKYKAGAYDTSLKQYVEYIEQIDNLSIKYPANASPIYHIYIVPDNNFIELLSYPSHLKTKGGGRPVATFDLDGFNSAFGISNNFIENREDSSIMQKINSIHELAHLVHEMFFNKDRLLAEGFAEALPLYTMNYQSKFEEHTEMLRNLKPEQILSAQELIVSAKNNNFNEGTIIPNKSVSFHKTYISSYLFVRGCLETIEKKYNVNRVGATQKLLEMGRESLCWNQFLIFDIANNIGIPQDDLLYSKDMQKNVIKNILKETK
ncbi:MAG: hypothetical protein ACOX6Q_03025 [Candidatus Dojkabacteria bacterium]|jgi:hypothetical protein